MKPFNELPIKIQMRMLEEQVEQGNPRSTTVFYKNVNELKHNGGFDWYDTLEGYDAWTQAILYDNYKPLYEANPDLRPDISPDLRQYLRPEDTVTTPSQDSEPSHRTSETMYRIKEVFQTTFNPNLIEKYQTAEQWEEMGVHKYTLEEVPNVFVTSGDDLRNGFFAGQEITGCKFFFTIHFPSITTDVEIPHNVIDQMTASCQNILNDYINTQK